MGTLNDRSVSDGTQYVLAAYYNLLLGSILRKDFSNAVTLSTDLELTDGDYPIQRLDCNGADRVVKVPPGANGNHPFFVINTTGVGGWTLTVKSNDGLTTHRVLSPGESVFILPDGNGAYLPLTAPSPAGPGGGGKYPAFTRLSVVNGNPNPTSSLAAQTSVHVMPYKGDTYPQWSSSDFVQQTFTAQTLALNAAHVQNSVYDVYLWLDGATQRIVTGPAWSSATSRGTGAGTAETEVLNGVQVNKVSMTVRNGANTYTMPARYGTLVGTICMSANGQVNWTSTDRGVWNKYNQLPAELFTCPGYTDDNAFTTYQTTGTNWAEANGGIGSRVKWVQGDAQTIHLRLTVLSIIGSSSSNLYGIGLDSITQSDVSSISNAGVATPGMITSNNKGLPLSTGSHYASFLIARVGANNGTFYADGRRAGEAVDSPATYLTGTVMM